MSKAATRAPGSRGGDGFSAKVAVLIAVLATMSTLFAFLSASAFNQATLFKSNAAMEKTSAANAWSHYQAKSTRQHLAELAIALPGADVERYRDEAGRYLEEKETIRREAERWERSSQQWDDKSAAALERQSHWSSAALAQQIAISLAAVTLLARRTWLLTVTGAVAAFGLALGLAALLNEPLLPSALVPLAAVASGALVIEAMRRLLGRRRRSGAPPSSNID